jgi:hypothetical protein
MFITNSLGPWKKFESTVVRLKRSYENTGSVVCLTTKGRQLERNFEELKPASHVPILRTMFLLLFLIKTQFIVNKQYCTKKKCHDEWSLMTMQQLKNINKTDKHIHAHKKRYLEVNREKKNTHLLWINNFECTHLTCVIIPNQFKYYH